MYCLSRNDTDNLAAFLTVHIIRRTNLRLTSRILTHVLCIYPSAKFMTMCARPLCRIWQAGGIKAEAYHAGKADNKRIKIQNNWRSGNTQVGFPQLRHYTSDCSPSCQPNHTQSFLLPNLALTPVRFHRISRCASSSWMTLVVPMIPTRNPSDLR